MKVNIPALYSSVTLAQFVAYKTAKSDVDKVCAITGEKKKVVYKWPIETLTKIIETFDIVLSKTMRRHDNVFRPKWFQGRIGLIPDFTQMTAGEYIDGLSYTQNIWKDKRNPDYTDLPKLMALLFRPVTYSMRGGGKLLYEVEPYDNERIRHLHLIEAMTMDRVDGALLFFSAIANELPTISQHSLLVRLTKEKKELEKMLAQLMEED
jgi:hypothetical protein